MSQESTSLASYIWSLADLLRGDFRQSQYGRIILPFTLLRRLECVLEETKPVLLAEYAKIQSMNLPEEGQEKFLFRVTGGINFFNTSPFDLAKLGESDLADNLEAYIQGFSKDAREIFEYFNFSEFIGQLSDTNLLYKVVQRVKDADLSPDNVSNREMGLVFEELIRRFAESSNDTAGEHFTPRDIVRLTTSLVFLEDDDLLTQEGKIRTIYDPTAGTGGFLSSGMEYVYEHNPKATIIAFGQELNPESYAICKADMLIKGQAVNNIKYGNTLSGDQLPAEKFDYMLSNPPFGVDWKKIEKDIKDEHSVKGFDGRFGAGLPRVSDGSLLFLMHLISKMRDKSEEQGSRIGIILNGSPLFTGGAGSGESEIRRYVIENDLLEAIVALPTDMFYNTGIATYIWVLSNKKSKERQGKVQLINGVHLHGKMRKSLGSKRNEMSESDIATVTRSFGQFIEEHVSLDKPKEQKSNRGRQSASPKKATPKTFGSKIFASHQFGYRRITIERPLRMSYQFSDERIETLRFAPKALYEPMKWIYDEFGDTWQTEIEAIRAKCKTDFTSLKEKQIKDITDQKIWDYQTTLHAKALQLQEAMGRAQCDDMNIYETATKKACKSLNQTLDIKEKKQIKEAVSWKNPEASKIIKKVHKVGTKATPFYGLFEVAGKVVEYQTDSDLRDYENIPLDPSQTVNEVNETYFKKEVLPHVPEAWIDGTKCDGIDEEIGIVGYEIPFNRHFYVYQPPRDLAEIDAELDTLSTEIMQLLQEVHS
ncbi:MAG: type I restriction-modification system subunit M [Desulfotalea sp.]